MAASLQIAIVHQDAETHHRLHTAVAQQGHSVCLHAGSGRELIEAAQQPELIVIQEFLADMPGLQAVQQACGNMAVPLIVAVDRNDGAPLDEPNGHNIFAVVWEPVGASDLIPLIPMVTHRFDQLQGIQQRIEHLQKELDEMD